MYKFYRNKWNGFIYYEREDGKIMCFRPGMKWSDADESAFDKQRFQLAIMNNELEVVK